MGKIDYNNYVEVGILLKEIECDATQIEIGDVHFQIANIEQFPFFRFEEPLKIRNKAIIEYYDFLEILNRRGDWTIWTRPENYANNEKQIYTFAEKRAGYVLKYMDELLPELE